MAAFHAALLCMTVAACLVATCSGYIEHPGPRFPPTKGEVWPKPQKQSYYARDRLSFSLENFEFQVVGSTCPALNAALIRYNALIAKQWPALRKSRRLSASRHLPGSQRRRLRLDSLTVLRINLTATCEQWPSLSMDEKYTLEVGSTEDPTGTSELVSKSLWGILRGLETFSQLLYSDETVTNELVINATSIDDFPRFTHRGLMLDTSRHYISLRLIKVMLDGMVYNKLNVFHWHIVDDHSFPYQSTKFPNLSAKGAYHPRLVYTLEDIQEVIEYARVRGIRVMSEFDTPGHTRSWGVAYPELLTQCYGSDGNPDGDLGPINPAVEAVYTFMEDLLTEVTTVFPEKYVHLGGDEVDFDCWENNPTIKAFMTENNIASYKGLEEVYIQKIVDIVAKLDSSSIVWQEVFLNGVRLPEGTVVQIWQGDQKALLKNVTASGLPALLSTCWYLDHLANGGDWSKYYDCDPHDFAGTAEEKELVLGGEACMWAEVVDNTNVLSRIFPRASAAAEKLWSAYDVNNRTEAQYRLEEHTCRLIARGINAQPPSGPGFCLALYDRE